MEENMSTDEIKSIQEALYALGVEASDTLLIHSSYKSMGEIEGGADTFFDAVLSYLGENGTLVMPALSYETVTFDQPYFSVKQTPSCVGYLPEYFRTIVEGVVRSMHATHSCCVKGKYAAQLIADHEKDETPVGENSPFRKLPYYDGKILFIGCSTNNNTFMHGVEEIADPPYWLNRSRRVEYTLEDHLGNQIRRQSYRHGFNIDGKRVVQRYSRMENLLKDNEIRRGKMLQADCTLMLSGAVWREGIRKMKDEPWYFVDRP